MEAANVGDECLLRSTPIVTKRANCKLAELSDHGTLKQQATRA